MRVEYDTTPADHEHFVTRIYQVYSPARGLHRLEIAWPTAVGMAIVTWILYNQSTIDAFALFIGAVMTMCFFALPLAYRMAVRKGVRQFVADLGEFATSPFEVELLPEGLFTRSFGVRVLTPWQQVRAIRDEGDRIELIIVPRGLATVSKRAFADEASIREFIETAEAYRRQAEAPPIRA